MRRLIGIAITAVLLGIGNAPADVLKVVVDDTIHPITDEYIGRALDQAKANHDAAVLIELRTPGGLVDSTRSIIEKILASPVPVIVYVAPTGSRAASAGFFILESADVAAMAPGTNTGAAHPVVLGTKLDDVMKEKLENDAAAFMRSFVSKRGRTVDVAESAVRQSKSFTEQEALSQKLIDVVAKDENDLFKQLEGRSIKRFDGSTSVLHLADQKVRILEMTLKQRILSFLMEPTIAIKARRNKVATGEAGLIGELAIAKTQLAPDGKVFVHGELWNASGPRDQVVPEGARLRVRSVRGLQLEVEPEGTAAIS